MAKYEILYIIRPNIEEEAKNALVARFDSILTDNGATVVESKSWEKRRLAYEIQDFREGLYHIVNVEANDDAALKEFDRLSDCTHLKRLLPTNRPAATNASRLPVHPSSATRNQIRPCRPNPEWTHVP